MRRAFGMFALTKADQRIVLVLIFALVLFALVKHYRETGTMAPARPLPAPQMSATPPSLPEEERANADDSR